MKINTNILHRYLNVINFVSNNSIGDTLLSSEKDININSRVLPIMNYIAIFHKYLLTGSTLSLFCIWHSLNVFRNRDWV